MNALFQKSEDTILLLVNGKSPFHDSNLQDCLGDFRR